MRYVQATKHAAGSHGIDESAHSIVLRRFAPGVPMMKAT